MAANPFDKNFLRNLNAQLDDLSRSGSDRARDRPAPQQTEPKFKARGAPGSPERWQQVMEMTPDPTLIGELAYESIGTHLQNALHQIRADENRDDFWEYDEPAYRPETVEAFTSAARMLGQVGDPQLFAAFSHELGEDSPLAEYLSPAVEQAATQGRIESYELNRAAEEQRMKQREQLLRREYQDIERRTGPGGVTAADQLARNLDQQGLLYHPDANEDQLRAQMRAVGEQARANQRALSQAAFLTEMDKEVARKYGPGSSWNDEEREKWEREMRTDTIETINRAFGDPADAGDRAIDGMIADDHRAATGKSLFEEALDAELAEHDSHARQNSPHLKALAEANVRDWEETHDPDGFNRVTQDGLGRESGGRYKP